MDQTALRASTLPQAVLDAVPCVWRNPHRQDAAAAFQATELARDLADRAALNWQDLAPLIAEIFPDTGPDGRIDSPFEPLPQDVRKALAGSDVSIWVKEDHKLPITGTIKARGGIYEVLRYATQLANDAGIIGPDDSLRRLAGAEAKAFFARHRIVTGSTGNLGYSIGVASAALGFAVEVHMSADAKQWKKERLRALGATVIEHSGDFGAAVAAARDVTLARDDSYLIDDENSVPLFEGYSAAAHDLRQQLDAAGLVVDAGHPMTVYLPCGVGGSPGGVTYGLKHIFGDAVRCVLIEPVAAPALLVQLASGLDKSVSVYDVGLDNDTIADGLAVAATSMLVARNVVGLVDAIVTVDDPSLFRWAAFMWRHAGMRLEPSAAAGFAGLHSYLADAPASDRNSLHVVWTTGGSQLPDHEFNANLEEAGRAEDGTP